MWILKYHVCRTELSIYCYFCDASTSKLYFEVSSETKSFNGLAYTLYRSRIPNKIFQ